MNIYEYIKLDHEKVAHLFKQFSKADAPERQEQIACMILHELLVHLISEQDTFYKALERANKENEGTVDHAVEEHQEIEEQMNLIKQSKKTNQAWVNKIKKLQDLVEHHVREEEHAIFSKAKKVFSEEEAIKIKEQMHDEKQRLILAIEKEKNK